MKGLQYRLIPSSKHNVQFWLDEFKLCCSSLEDNAHGGGTEFFQINLRYGVKRLACKNI